MKAIEDYFKKTNGADQMIIMREANGAWLIQTRQGYFRGKTLEEAVALAAKKIPRK